MGSKHSDGSNKNNKEITEDLYKEKGGAFNSGFFIKDNYSSYKGIKSSFNEGDGTGKLSTSSDTVDPVTISDSSNLNQDPNLVNTRFVWKEGGNNVYMTGSFVNWNQRFLMTKEDNDYVLELVII